MKIAITLKLDNGQTSKTREIPATSKDFDRLTSMLTRGVMTTGDDVAADRALVSDYLKSLPKIVHQFAFFTYDETSTPEDKADTVYRHVTAPLIGLSDFLAWQTKLLEFAATYKADWREGLTAGRTGRAGKTYADLSDLSNFTF